MKSLRLYAFILTVSAALMGPMSAQNVVTSFPTASGPNGFYGGCAFDPMTDTIWTCDNTNDVIEQYDKAGNLLQSHAAVVPPIAGAPPVCCETGCPPG